MFCPLAVDYGNVADWFSGVGSVSAVAVALWIAIRDRRTKSQEDKARELRLAQEENAMISEAVMLHQSLFAQVDRMLDVLDGNGQSMEWNDLENEALLIRETARRLQQLPSVTIRVYQAFDNLIRLSHRISSISYDATSFEELSSELESVKRSTIHHFERLKANPNPLAPLVI